MQSRLLAFAQLLRLPNGFTAVADILLGTVATGVLLADPLTAAFLMLASLGLYHGGLASNDYFDRDEDAKTRPFRPIPSGRISPRTARRTAIVLTVSGLMFALGATLRHPPAPDTLPPIAIAVLVAVLVLLYNPILKHTAAGAWAMGGCRALNVLLGLSAGSLPIELTTHLALTVGVYIAGITLFARREEFTSPRRSLARAAGVMAAAALSAALVPMHDPETLGFRPYPYLVAAWAVWVGVAVAAALRDPQPKPVQTAVKRGIFGLMPLDAILASAFVGAPGLLIALLILPARWLGKRVYST